MGSRRSPGARQEVLQRARVVAQHGALAHAEAAAALDVDDVAVGEQRRARFDRLASGPSRPGWRRRRGAMLDDRVGARLEVALASIDGRIAAATTAVGSTL